MAKGTAESIDAIVTDPPYGLGFMGKEWDALLPGEAWARECLRVLKPGGHLLAFGGTRTYHRLVCALEDAGFEIRDCIAWMYGTGFPKSRNIGDGWGTALKPAFEPIVVARKPLSEKTVAANVQRWGTGALNIDGTRIEANEVIERGDFVRNQTPDVHSGYRRPNHGMYTDKPVERSGPANANGRWPANVALDEDAAAALDEQSGERPGYRSQQHLTPGDKFGGTAYSGGLPLKTGESTGYNDTGGASRFFYVAKASRKERGEGNDHPTVKPVELMRWLVRLVTLPGGRVLDPFMGSGTTGIAALAEGFSFIGIELDVHYHEIAASRIAAAQEEAA